MLRMVPLPRDCVAGEERRGEIAAMTPDTDTIAALSSGALPSGIAIIRLSGPQTRPVLESLSGDLPAPRLLTLRSLRLGAAIIDTGLVAWMPAPHSFTGEDTAELQVRIAGRGAHLAPGYRCDARSPSRRGRRIHPSRLPQR